MEPSDIVERLRLNERMKREVASETAAGICVRSGVRHNAGSMRSG